MSGFEVMRVMRRASSFGQYLRQRGLVSDRALEGAVQKLVLVGGRLGTRLLEAGELDVESLEKHLSDFLGVPRAPAQWLAEPAPEALAAVPSDLVRHGALPLHAEASSLHVAMRDPKDAPGIEALARAAKRRIVPYVISEGRLAFLLERHFGIRPEGRLECLRPDLVHARKRKRARPRKRPAAWPEVEEFVRQRERLGIAPLSEDDELVDAKAFASLVQNWEAGVQQRQESPALTARIPQEAPSEIIDLDCEVPAIAELKARPSALAALQADLDCASDRDGVTRAALAIASLFVDSAAFFVIHESLILGLLASRSGAVSSIDAILLPTAAQSTLSDAASSGSRVCGPADGPIDTRLARALGHDDPAEVAALPVTLSGRVVSVLRVDNGDRAIGSIALAALSELTSSVAGAYTRVILDRRRRYCGSE